MKSFFPVLDTKMVVPKHGGDLLKVRREEESETKTNWIDLSSAVNRHPWPIPIIPEFLWYELPDQHSLKLAASNYYKHSNFVPLAGTQQGIECLPTILFTHAFHSFKSELSPKVLVPNIGYQEHKFAWEKWGYHVESYQSFNELVEIDWQVAVLIQPNNPKAESFPNEQIKVLIELANARHGYLIIDEAFIDPIEDKSVLSLYAEIRMMRQENTQAKKSVSQKDDWPESLILLRSVGKFFGLAGARIGFLFASKNIRDKVSITTGPWPISTPSVWLVSQALMDKKWQQEAKQNLRARSEFFQENIIPLLNTLCDHFCFSYKEWRVSDLFFTLFFLQKEVPKEAQGKKQADGIFTHLQSVGIHVRLGDNWLRFALPAEEEFILIEERLQSLLVEFKVTYNGHNEKVLSK